MKDHKYYVTENASICELQHSYGIEPALNEGSESEETHGTQSITGMNGDNNSLHNEPVCDLEIGWFLCPSEGQHPSWNPFLQEHFCDAILCSIGEDNLKSFEAEEDKTLLDNREVDGWFLDLILDDSVTLSELEDRMVDDPLLGATSRHLGSDQDDIPIMCQDGTNDSERVDDTISLNCNPTIRPQKHRLK
jgi:hypothetical protein